MPAALRIWYLPFAATLLALVGSSGAAEAGWVAIKNDTNQVIVVQWAVQSNGQTKRCRPVRLLPGESVHEFRNTQTLTVEVFDTQKPTKLLHTGHLNLTPANQSFSVSSDGKTVNVSPAPPR